MISPILAPAAVLVLWSILVLFWVMVTRMQAFAKAGVSLGDAQPGSRYADVEKDMPASANWKSHNFVHLMEQPTLFYAAVAILALAGQGTGINLSLAWGYVGLRIAHSLWQGLVNTVPVRFGLYLLSTLCLLVMAINAVRFTLLL
jgi:hypothetical protein